MKSRSVTIQMTAFDERFPEVAFAFSFIPSDHCVKPGKGYLYDKISSVPSGCRHFFSVRRAAIFHFTVLYICLFRCQWSLIIQQCLINLCNIQIIIIIKHGVILVIVITCISSLGVL